MLRELVIAAFPNGFPDTYTHVPNEVQLQFVTADVKIFFDDEQGNQEFRDVLCQWDSGAHVSFIPGELLALESMALTTLKLEASY